MPRRDGGTPLQHVLIATTVLVMMWWGRASATETPWGLPVVQIRLKCDAELNVSDFTSQITQKVGEPLEPPKVAESIKNLFATGRFTELRVDAEPKENGVELIFVGGAQFFVGVVSVEGVPKPVDTSVLRGASRLRLGQPVSEEVLAIAEQRLATVLGENGYYLASVQPRVLRHPDNQQADVTFVISASQPARLREIEFQGRTLVPPVRLAKLVGWRVGDHLTSAKLERGLSKVRRFYVKRGYSQARISVQARIYDPSSNTERLVVQVETGPRIRVRVKGARVSSSRLRELLPVLSEGFADDQAIPVGQRNLEDYFERKGFIAPSVKTERVASADSQELHITYIVSLGERRALTIYEFTGNREISREELAAALDLKPRDKVLTREPFSRELLAQDAGALKSFYEVRGFLEARIVPQQEIRQRDHARHKWVTFQIEEGPRTTVGKVEVHGVDADTAQRVQSFLLTKPGQPYSPGLAETGRDSILRHFVDQGYTDARVSWKASPVSASGQIDLEYQVHLDRQETIKGMVVTGNEHTRLGIVRRELTFHPAEPVSQSKLLESQRQLYGLGVFNQVQIATQNPESTETAKTVLVNVEEAQRWTVGYGGGLEVQRLGSNDPQGQFRASPRFSLDVTRLNFGGRAQTLTLRGRFSSLETGGALSYLIPRFPTRPDLTLRINALVDRSRDVLTFTADRKEGSITIEKHYSPRTLVLGRYSFRRVRARDVQISAEQIPLLSRRARIAMLSISYINDHRDDPTDATEGSYSLADAGVSWQGLGSEANFVRISAQNSTYYRLGSHLIFARNTRFGVETPFGGLRTVEISEGAQAGQVVRTRDIPLPERFFMGGSESHRGFSINQAGPRDPVTGFPVGGNALLLNSLELRFPFAENRFGVVLFQDAGNVYSSIRKMRLLKFTQGFPTDFDYTIHAVGLGIRYKTPVGPLRLDAGYNLNSPRFFVGQEVRRLSPLQFFLSIGQSF